MLNFERLFEPITINSLELRNRLVVPGMGTNFANADGTVSECLRSYLLERAKGGFALITTEAVSVDPDGKDLPFQLGIWDDKFIPGFRVLADAIHEQGAKIAIQLFHPGRQTSRKINSRIVAPSPIPCPVVIDPPQELTVREIEEIEKKFADAASRAQEAGIDAIELHGAHGYLIAEFMSRYSNCRIDEYGGGLGGLLRFPIELIRVVRERVGLDYPLIFRISGTERVPGGRSIQETKTMAVFLKKAGVNVFHVSTGTYGSFQYIIPPMCVPPGFNVLDASEVRKVTSLPVIAVGRINDPYMIEGILREGSADLVALGRQSIADPEFPKKVAEGNLEDIRWCISCNQGCIDRVFTGKQLSCLVNPRVGREDEIHVVQALRRKKIFVIGGGPAGLAAARVAALKGHEVHLYEKSNKLGGQLNLASILPCKQDIAKAVKYLSTQVKTLGVRINLNTEVTVKIVADLQPEVIIIATGSEPLNPDIPGIDNERVTTAFDILRGKTRPGQNILIIGGGLIGAETADLLSQLRGRQVTLVEVISTIATDLGQASRFFLMDRLEQQKVTIITGAKVKEIQCDSVILDRDSEEEILSGFDTIVVAIGVKSVDGLFDQLKQNSRTAEVYIIGDANKPKKAIDAIEEGDEIMRRI